MQRLHQLNLAENLLEQLPEAAADEEHDWSNLASLEELWLYSNELKHIPSSILRCPALASKLCMPRERTSYLLVVSWRGVVSLKNLHHP